MKRVFLFFMIIFSLVGVSNSRGEGVLPDIDSIFGTEMPSMCQAGTRVRRYRQADYNILAVQLLEQ